MSLCIDGFILIVIHMLSVLDQRRLLIVFFTVAKAGGSVVTFITPSLLLVFRILFLMFKMFSFMYGLGLLLRHKD